MTEETDSARDKFPVTRDDIAQGFRELGVKPGDILYLRCGLTKIGFRPRDAEQVFLGGIRDALGPDGTLITPAFGPMSYRWNKEPVSVDRDTPPITGAFSKLVLKQADAVRSDHPTHSFAGIGRSARDVLAGHGADTPCFEPIRKIVEADGLMAVVGCVAESPGFSTVHLAQHDLGLSQRHYLRLAFAVRQADAGGKIFHPWESPGCSDNFGVFYKDYVESGNFTSGYVGKGWSIAVRARAAYDRERAILEADPRYTLCSRRDCLSCHLTRGYNKRSIPGALLHRARVSLSKLAAR